MAEATSKPFALNLWLSLDEIEQPQIDAQQFDAYAENLRPYFDALEIDLPVMPLRYVPSFEEQIAATIEARPAVLSFVYGVPSTEVVALAHDRGIVVVGTATTVDEAIALELGGVDAVVASGMEAGGHRISFLQPPERSLIGTFALIPQVVDAVSIPVIAAGGIADGRGLAAATVLGADAVQVGSAFLATEESAAAPAHRAALRSNAARHTVLTTAFSGRLARGIPNRVTEELTDPTMIAPFPIQGWLTGQFRSAAGDRGISDLMSLWAGQATPLVRHSHAQDVINEMMRTSAQLIGS